MIVYRVGRKTLLTHSITHC